MKLTFWVHKYNQDKEKLIQQHLFGSSIQPGEKKWLTLIPPVSISGAPTGKLR